MKYFNDDIKLYKFEDENHLNNHFNYLFRTDKKQKWTNKDTIFDFFFFPNDEEYFLNEDLEKRISIKESIKEKILKETKNGYKDLFMARIESNDDKAYIWTEEMLEEMDKFIKELNESDNIDVLLVVLHNDQPQNLLHFHIILK